jgi:hypothetical protein
MEIGKMEVRGQWGKKLVRPHLNQKARHRACSCHPSYRRGINRNIDDEGLLCKKARLYLKNN